MGSGGASGVEALIEKTHRLWEALLELQSEADAYRWEGEAGGGDDQRAARGLGNPEGSDPYDCLDLCGVDVQTEERIVAILKEVCQLGAAREQEVRKGVQCIVEYARAAAPPKAATRPSAVDHVTHLEALAGWNDAVVAPPEVRIAGMGSRLAAEVHAANVTGVTSAEEYARAKRGYEAALEAAAKETAEVGAHLRAKVAVRHARFSEWVEGFAAVREADEELLSLAKEQAAHAQEMDDLVARAARFFSDVERDLCAGLCLRVQDMVDDVHAAVPKRRAAVARAAKVAFDGARSAIDELPQDTRWRLDRAGRAFALAVEPTVAT